MKYSLLFVLLLAGCASVTVLKKYPAISPENVKVILDNDDNTISPSCQAEQIGHISTAWEWSGEAAINTAKEKAAAIGGDYIKGKLKINNFNDGMLEATVYKCN